MESESLEFGTFLIVWVFWSLLKEAFFGLYQISLNRWQQVFFLKIENSLLISCVSLFWFLERLLELRQKSTTKSRNFTWRETFVSEFQFRAHQTQVTANSDGTWACQGSKAALEATFQVANETRSKHESDVFYATDQNKMKLWNSVKSILAEKIAWKRGCDGRPHLRKYRNTIYISWETLPRRLRRKLREIEQFGLLKTK